MQADFLHFETLRRARMRALRINGTRQFLNSPLQYKNPHNGRWLDRGAGQNVGQAFLPAA